MLLELTLEAERYAEEDLNWGSPPKTAQTSGLKESWTRGLWHALISIHLAFCGLVQLAIYSRLALNLQPSLLSLPSAIIRELYHSLIIDYL